MSEINSFFHAEFLEDILCYQCFPSCWGVQQQQQNVDKNPFVAEAYLMEVEELTDNKQIKHAVDHVVISAEEKNENKKENEHRA